VFHLGLNDIFDFGNPPSNFYRHTTPL
jgi:hypothetical protein